MPKQKANFVEIPYTVIRTKWIPATNTRPSRIKAYTDQSRRFSVTISDPMDDISRADKHARAAHMLLHKMNWQAGVTLVCSPTEEGYVFIEMRSDCLSDMVGRFMSTVEFDA